MTGWANNMRRSVIRRLFLAVTPLGVALGLIVAVGAVPAMAQPLRLTPADSRGNDAATPEAKPDTPPRSAPSQTTTPPQMNTPPLAAPQQAQPVATPAAPPASADGVVQIQALKAPDPSSTGLIGDDAGGLGTTMWQGSRRAAAEQAVALLPAPVFSPALRDLQRRLLLTLAEAPEGSGGSPSLLALRVEQLYRLGLVTEAAQLGIPKPAQLQDSIFTRLPVSLALLKNDANSACEMGEKALRDDPSAPAWLRLAVFCRYRAGNVAGGDLAIGLWREQAEPDAAFQALAAAARGDAGAKVEQLGAADTVSLALFRHAKRPLPARGLDQVSPVILGALAEMPELDADLRLQLLERAALAGAIPPQRLGQAYARTEIAENLRADIMAGKNRTARAAAFLMQQLRLEPPGPGRAAMAQKLYDLALARGLLLPTAAAIRESLRDLPPSGEAAPHGVAVIRLGLAAGETGLARLWRNSLLALGNPDAMQGALETWPLLLLADPPREWPAAAFEAWQKHVGEHHAARSTELRTTFLVLAEASGIAVPLEVWQQLAQPGQQGSGTPPPLAYWRNLLRAADAGARAETVALVLAVLGPDGLARADLASLSTAFGALRRVKLDTELRSLILEAAISRGL